MERVLGHQDVRTDFVKAGAGKMKKLTVDKGLLRLTEAVQIQIESLVQCDVSGETVQVKQGLTRIAFEFP